MVRLSASKIDDKAWARLLNRQAFRDGLNETYDGAFDDAVKDVLRSASQVTGAAKSRRRGRVFVTVCSMFAMDSSAN